MPPLRSTHVEVYVFRRRGRRVEFLALKRAAGRRKLPGVWQPITGSRERFESPIQAAAREVGEETGLSPKRWWALESVTTYVDAASGALIVLPLFAAEADARAKIRLSDEHDDFGWLSAAKAGRRYLWESQRRGLEAVRREVLGNARLAEMLEITHLVAPTPAAQTKTRTAKRAGRADRS